MRHRTPRVLYAFLLIFHSILGFSGCNDVSSVSTTPTGTPEQLAILTTSPLPDGTVNVAYSVALAASGGTPGYTWSLGPNSPALPPGLTLSAGGVISGKPIAPGGPVNLIIQVVDSGGVLGNQQTVTKTLALTINLAPTPLAILTSSLPSGSINQPYATALGGNGGTTPYTWGVKAGSPPLPTGLTLTPSTGAITGTPTVTGTTTLVFTLTDATSSTVEASLPLTISAVPLSITTDSLTQGTANQSYSAQLDATGGTGAYTWAVAAGSPPLPAGLSLNPSSGLISGVPTGPSTQSITFSVTDQTPPTPQTVTKMLSLVIAAATPTLTITSASLPPGTVTQSYSATLTASGGTGGDTWDLASGTLPPGLLLSPAGAISGVPTTAGTFTPTFRVKDSGSPQQSATKALSITISLPTPPDITTTSLPNGKVTQSYSQTLQVSGGVAPFAWSVASGQLPPGLALSTTTGTISGTPTQAGTFMFTPQVVDATAQSDPTPPLLTVTITP